MWSLLGWGIIRFVLNMTVSVFLYSINWASKDDEHFTDYRTDKDGHRQRWLTDWLTSKLIKIDTDKDDWLTEWSMDKLICKWLTFTKTTHKHLDGQPQPPRHVKQCDSDVSRPWIIVPLCVLLISFGWQLRSSPCHVYGLAKSHRLRNRWS